MCSVRVHSPDSGFSTSSDPGAVNLPASESLVAPSRVQGDEPFHGDSSALPSLGWLVPTTLGSLEIASKAWFETQTERSEPPAHEPVRDSRLRQPRA